MTYATPHPRYLRLVGTRDEQATTSGRADLEVARENRRAAMQPGLDPTDPRWVLATRAYAQLQGSTLTPERRTRVMRTAQHLGIRPFEANLIIAVMQDQARRHQPPGAAQSTLQMISVKAETRPRGAWGRWLAAMLSALALASLLIHWLTSV